MPEEQEHEVRPWTARKAIELGTKLRPRVMRLYARAVFTTLAARINAAGRLTRARWRIISVVLIGVVVLELKAYPAIHARLAAYFTDTQAFAGLKALCLGLGGALLGATAIASSFILFAMQVNVERMPAGLFRRLSADRNLLLTFALAFGLSTTVTIASVAPTADWATLIVVGMAHICLLMPLIYLYAYRRALQLISPVEQLGMVVRHARRDIGKWSKWADLARYIGPDGDEGPLLAGERRVDSKRLAFFRVNGNWEAAADQAIRHVTLYARSYAERGDHEVSNAALRALFEINAAYIRAKGDTFFNDVPLIENPLVTDGLINETLEALSQTMKIAVARGDERLATQILRSLGQVLGLYLTINYPGVDRNKTHALLAAGYLSSAIEAVVPHNMPDVLMEGVRLLGQGSVAFIQFGATVDSVGSIEKIGIIGAVGMVRDDLRPVLLTAVEQLSTVTLALLLVRARDIGVILGISHRIVERHVFRACQKLGVKTRLQAVIRARSLGLIRDMPQPARLRRHA